MEKITFTCETITPMFLAGADGKTPELRPPSIKAAMRFWWRALHGHLPLPQLKMKENTIFGGAGKDKTRSPFSVITSHAQVSPEPYNAVPHRNRPIIFQGIKPGVEFEITLINNRCTAFNYVKDLLTISLILGGLGKRSRRGFGSVRILKIDNKEFVAVNIEMLYTLVNAIVSGTAFSCTSVAIERTLSGVSNFGYIEKIHIGNSFAKSEDLLYNISNSSHENNCQQTGYANGGRFASPVYVSVIKRGSDFYPIFSELHLAPGSTLTTTDRRMQFIAGI